MNREAFFDNAKIFLIFLVVFGHLIQPLITESPVILTMYQFIYLFHMPAMILLTGFFAKGIGKLGYVSNLMRKLLLPYLLFQLIYSSYFYYTGSEGWDTPLFYPHWSLWFLLSLFSWHILLIFFKKIPPFFGISLAVILGLLVGYIDTIGHTYSISRTFVFFPFFLGGYWLTKEQIFQWKEPVYRLISLVVILLTVLILTILPDFQVQWLFGSFSYGALEAPQLGVLFRIAQYFFGISLAFSIFAWVPRQPFYWTKFGQQTFYVYLLHGLFIHFFRETEILRINNVFEFLLVCLLAMAIVLLLSSRVVFLSFQPVIEGKLTALKLAMKGKKSTYTVGNSKYMY
ncbi:fucose 4-O-acetylase-like acetyltransferase [Natronobacillus azotifigens]|uniref:Acyltransferase family protein n=1 Tax=Natronobacillus azotifigens TaxID=472978 RepID=A0A9J6RBD0_9BACI|nr:acyltransferase family protein [Natronobacillus azotifigens]MCZ0702537.1 acyltransferase family protein [Natronobacillus azotifigens]